MGETALHKCTRNGHYPAVKEIINYVKNGHNGKFEDFVNIPNTLGETSLHLAARNKKTHFNFPEEDVKIIQLLMENGSDVFVQTKEVKF